MGSLNDSYDVVIVGGGNAGCVLAARLSEVHALKILLLETGPDHSRHPGVPVPAGGAALQSDPSINWAYETVPQEGYEGRSIEHPRGKGLGGSTLLNLNCMTFPDRHSIDNFEALGNKGWSYRDMQPYYRKFHTFHEPAKTIREHLGLKYIDSSVHGTSGPIQVCYGNSFDDSQNAWWRTYQTLGKECTFDPLSGDALGGICAPGTIDPSGFKRSHAAAAYLTPEVKLRPNLEIITEAAVDRLLFADGPRPRVRAVQFTKNGTTQVVEAVHEVLLCSGVFNSPQILELSGIGSKQILGKLDIQQVVELPGVGENLQDHSVVAVSFESQAPTFDSFRDPNVIGAAFQDYVQHQKGPLTTGTFLQGFMPCVSALSGPGKDQITNLIEKEISKASPALRKQHGLIKRIVQDPNLSSVQFLAAPIQAPPSQNSRPVPAEARLSDYFTLYASLSHPFSRGSCHAVSPDINQPPAIDPRYFENPVDVEILARHLQFLDTLATTKPLADLVKPGGRTIPTDLNLKSLDYTRELIQTGFTTYHPCGTCAMVPEADGGVVDSRLRVYGVEGLRVVDASIFPLVPRGNIQSSVYAVAERAADLIKEEFEASTA